jgi:hypothetical protein
MADILKKALQLLTGNDPSSLANFKISKKNRPLKALTERELIQLESEIGSQLFGPVPKGHRREFFNLDPTTWIWHEESVDANGKTVQFTTRYEVQENGVLKVQEGARYTFLEGQELQNLTLAVQIYYERVMREVYHRDPQSGQKLA